MYTQDDEKGWQQSNAFKKTFSIDVDIEFVGVWYVNLPTANKTHTSSSSLFAGTP